MTSPAPARKPQTFDVDDPTLVIAAAPERAGDAGSATPPDPGRLALPTGADIAGGLRWGAILLSAMLALAGLAASLWFTRFVSVAIARDDWLGWTATALLALAALAAVAILLREIVGLMRLGRLGRIRRDARAALAGNDLKLERATVARLANLLAGRKDLAWGLARLAEHKGDVRDCGELMALADRELLAPADAEARRLVLASAKRITTVTALSPMLLIGVGYVLVENLRMLRKIATLYGGRPGLMGALRLARMVVSHLVATGGVALTDDLVGQFIGQDLLRRVSRRLGEGAFNGALTARVGAAAIEVTRPLPFLEAPPVRVRDILVELFRKPREQPRLG
jgi:putative membrane protein